MELSLDFNHYCTEDWHDGEEYGSWHSSYEYSVGTYARDYKGPYGKNRAVYEGTLERGEIVYAILAVWSSGDSFGNSDRGSYDFVSLNKDHNIAQENLEALNSAHRDSKGGDVWEVTLKQDDGKEIKYFRSWLGYFESLDSLEIHPFIYA